METQGAFGSAPGRDHASDRALNEFLESAAGGLVKAQAEVSFDEFNLDVDIRYDGERWNFQQAADRRRSRR
jgi:hypothetical protein